MSLKKQLVKSKNVYRITFSLNKEEVNGEKVSVCGDFNNWNPEVHVMEKFKNGNFKTTIELSPGKEYQFRYLIDNKNWINDSESDQIVENELGSTNCVVVC
jgi:1,4-alpha-glucan branching enzyme